MKFIFQKIKLLIPLIWILSSVFSQKIVHLEGSYDLDGDNLFEFNLIYDFKKYLNKKYGSK